MLVSFSRASKTSSSSSSSSESLHLLLSFNVESLGTSDSLASTLSSWNLGPNSSKSARASAMASLSRLLQNTRQPL
jgi:hypothetical protein